MRTRFGLPGMALALGLCFGGASWGQIPDLGPCAPDVILGAWLVNANGHSGALNVTSLDGTGKITGTMVFGTLVRQIQGFWSASRCQVTFLQASSLVLAVPGEMQFYTGYAYNYQGLKRLAGSFVAFAGTGGSAERHTFGWDAVRR